MPKSNADEIDYATKTQQLSDGIVKNLKFLGADGQWGGLGNNIELRMRKQMTKTIYVLSTLSLWFSTFLLNALDGYDSTFFIFYFFGATLITILTLTAKSKK